MGMPVNEILNRFSSRELAEWMAYYQLEPWGEERGDLRAGIVASVTANAFRDAKKTKKAYKPEDFMPQYGQPKKKAQSWQEMRDGLMRWLR